MAISSVLFLNGEPSSLKPDDIVYLPILTKYIFYMGLSVQTALNTLYAPPSKKNLPFSKSLFRSVLTVGAEIHFFRI